MNFAMRQPLRGYFSWIVPDSGARAKEAGSNSSIGSRLVPQGFCGGQERRMKGERKSGVLVKHWSRFLYDPWGQVCIEKKQRTVSK